MATAPTLHSHSYDSGLLERLLFRVARKWVAGHDQNDAICSARNSNSRGIKAILNFLGEDAIDRKTVDSTIQEYIKLIERIGREQIDGCVSIKPTQFGLAFDYELCLENYRLVADKAKQFRQFIWIDMESARFVKDTISIYLELARRNRDTIGIAVQSYLRRSSSDLMNLQENGGIVRLVKGAYHEPGDVAFASRADVDSNYSKLMQMLFDSKNDFAIATHDSDLIDGAIRLAARSEESVAAEYHKQFEFQMLMGIRDELKSDLVSKGFKVSEYIPYGSHWLPYSIRRLREHKRNILLLARSLL